MLPLLTQQRQPCYKRGTYVRSVNGRDAAWFRGAQTKHEGQLRTGTIEKNIALLETDQAGDQIDAAYPARYGKRYPTIVPSILRPARSRRDAEARTERSHEL